MIQKGHKIHGAKPLILAVTFKENCPDIRNSRIIDIYKELQQFGLQIDIYNPCADKHDVKEEYNLDLRNDLNLSYDAIILAVSHDEFLTIDYSKLAKGKEAVIFDTKAVLARNIINARL